MTSQKIKQALEYFQLVAVEDPTILETRISEIVGEDFAVFMNNYSVKVIMSHPESAATLMLMGYMLRVHEESAGLTHNPFPQVKASA